MEFPLHFDKCRKCGSADRVGETVANELKAKGKLPAEMIYGTRVGQSLFAHPITPSLTVTVLITVYDLCAKCGLEYPTHILRQEVPVTSGLGKTGGRPPGFSGPATFK